MKFSEVPMFAKIKTNESIFIKVFSDIIYDYIHGGVQNVNVFWHDGVNHKVELLTKCENCKHYQESCNATLEQISKTTQEIMGEKMSLVYKKQQDPETFSCSMFVENDK